MSTMFLSVDEIKQLTGRIKRKKQIEVLNALGVFYVINGIDELVISRNHVENKLKGSANQQHNTSTPNYSMFNDA